MLEIPESITIVKQINETLIGKIISYVEANHSPHSFTWYFGDPKGYDGLLSGKKITAAKSHGGMVEILVEDSRILFGDGANLRYYNDKAQAPKKHQLYIEFDDQSALVVTVMMYGGIWAYTQGQNDNPYYIGSVEKINPLSDNFTYEYFMTLLDEKSMTKSVKAFLATEQRIPGLGNGVLQDILYQAKIHPKRKMSEISEDERRNLFRSVKETLLEMTQKGGRDT